VDLELNARLNRLAADQSRMLALPPALGLAMPGAVSGRPGVRRRSGAVPPGPRSGPRCGTRPPPPPRPWPLVPAELAQSSSGLTPTDVKPGQTLLGRYRVEKELAAAAWARFYLAHDAQLGEVVR